jgi:hypothetical protein
VHHNHLVVHLPPLRLMSRCNNRRPAPVSPLEAASTMAGQFRRRGALFRPPVGGWLAGSQQGSSCSASRRAAPAGVKMGRVGWLQTPAPPAGQLRGRDPRPAPGPRLHRAALRQAPEGCDLRLHRLALPPALPPEQAVGDRAGWDPPESTHPLRCSGDIRKRKDCKQLAMTGNGRRSKRKRQQQRALDMAATPCYKIGEKGSAFD